MDPSRGLDSVSKADEANAHQENLKNLSHIVKPCGGAQGGSHTG